MAREDRQARKADRIAKRQADGNLGGGGGFSAVAGIAGQALNGIGNALRPKRYADDPQQMQAAAIRDSISDAAISSGNTMAMAIGLGAKITDIGMDAIGMRADLADPDAAKRAGMKGQGFAKVMNMLPGNILAFGGSKTIDAYKHQEIEEVADAFSGTVADIDAAQKLGGKSFMWGIGRKKANKFIKEQNRKDTIIAGISRINTLRKESDYSQNLDKQNYLRYSGYDNQSAANAVGRNGMKLFSKEEIQSILAKRKEKPIEAFKEGGVIGVDTNVLPEGALHVHKNHIEEENKEIGEVCTTKGIPVVVTDKNGNIEQVAEIEHSEIILRKELTNKIEELRKKNTDEAAIEAGKLLAKEFITNTTDNREL